MLVDVFCSGDSCPKEKDGKRKEHVSIDIGKRISVTSAKFDNGFLLLGRCIVVRDGDFACLRGADGH